MVDEVLAVGDAEFQKKCLGKMQDVSRGGRTVLFVSHNISTVSALCNRGILLGDGCVKFDGSVSEALALYSKVAAPALRSGVVAGDQPRVLGVVVDEVAASRGDLRVSVKFDSPWPLDPPLLGIVVSTSSGAPIFGLNTTMDPHFRGKPAKQGELLLEVSNAPLHSGIYNMSIYLGEKLHNYVSLRDMMAFSFVAPVNIPAGVAIDQIGFTRVDGRFRFQE